jgi:hypothetical protein
MVQGLPSYQENLYHGGHYEDHRKDILMPGWIPRWHPVVWAVVIILFIAVVSDPVGWAGRVQGLLHDLDHIAHQLTVFFTSI